MRRGRPDAAKVSAIRTVQPSCSMSTGRLPSRSTRAGRDGTGPAFDPVGQAADREPPSEQLLGQRIGIGPARFLHPGAARARSLRADLDARDRRAQRRREIDALAIAAHLHAESSRDAFALVALGGKRGKAPGVDAVGRRLRRRGAAREEDGEQHDQPARGRRSRDARATRQPRCRHRYSPMRRRAMVDLRSSLPGSCERTSRSSLRAPLWSPDAHSTSARWIATSASGFAL